MDSQIQECHRAFRTFEEYQVGLSHTADIAFDRPFNVGALQAADMIAWSNRKAALGEPFTGGFEPLELLTDLPNARKVAKRLHVHFPVTRERTESLAHAIVNGEPLPKIGRLELSRFVREGYESSNT